MDKGKVWFWIRFLIAIFIVSDFARESWLNAHGSFFLEGLFSEVALIASVLLSLFVVILDIRFYRKRSNILLLLPSTALSITLFFGIYWYVLGQPDFGKPVYVANCTNCTVKKQTLYFYESGAVRYEFRYDHKMFSDKYIYTGNYTGAFVENGHVIIDLEWFAPKYCSNFDFDTTKSLLVSSEGSLFREVYSVSLFQNE
ncbi:MAG: hypothetical protein JXQ87_06465 [Bacteroidia bacterium]